MTPRKRSYRDVCVAAVVSTRDNRILLQKRDDNVRIEFPGYWSLVAGRPIGDEAPRFAIARELGEEIALRCHGQVEFSPIEYLGCHYRSELDRIEYVFHVTVLSNPSSLEIREGKGLGFFTVDECNQLKRFAPHHASYIAKYRPASTM